MVKMKQRDLSFSLNSYISQALEASARQPWLMSEVIHCFCTGISGPGFRASSSTIWERSDAHMPAHC